MPQVRRDPQAIAKQHHRELQQLFLRDDQYIPGLVSENENDLARTATVTASSEAALVMPEMNVNDYHSVPLAQILPVSADRGRSGPAQLRSDEPAPVRLNLRSASTVWDFEGEVLASTEAVLESESD